MTGIESAKTVTTTQAASIIGVSRATVARFCDEGRLPYAKPGKHRVLRLADVLEFKADTTHRQEDPVADNRDTTAAERATVFLETWTANGGGDEIQTVYDLRDRLSFPALTATDLSAVLAENREMRQQLDGMGTEWSAGHPYDDGRPGLCMHGNQGEYNARQMASHGDGWQVMRRLVGDWQTAGEAAP